MYAQKTWDTRFDVHVRIYMNLFLFPVEMCGASSQVACVHFCTCWSVDSTHWLFWKRISELVSNRLTTKSFILVSTKSYTRF